eukprot:scaffold584_cov132-Cylindrotheca_fusiformis.AAC.26
MASIGRPDQGPSMSKVDRQGEIQLSERQMQLMEARKRAKEAGLQTSQFNGSNMSGAKRDPTPRMDSKPSQGYSWSDEQTVPTTWSDSSSSANSAVSRASSRAVSSVVSAAMSRASSGSHTNPAQQFYAQGLTKQEKKLYDDSGESYYGSRSEASGPTSRNGGNKQSHQEHEVKPRRVDRVPRIQIPTQDVMKPQDMAPLVTGDQQKAFLRKMMKSYAKKPSKAGKDNRSETPSDASSMSESASRVSWGQGKSKGSSTASSRSSTASHDKAIMRKVLERARNKKMALSNPRKHGLLKQSSSRMKKLISPKKSMSSPSSRKSASPSSSASSTSGGSQFSNKFGLGNMLNSRKKKVSRSPRFSSRNAKTRKYKNPESLFPTGQEYAHDDVAAQKKYLERNSPTVESTASTASETISKEASVTTRGNKNLVRKLYDDSGASVALSENASEISDHGKENSDMSVASKPEDVHIERQATDVSALTRKHSDEGAQSLDIARSKSTIDSIPEVASVDQMENNVSVSSLSQRFDSNDNKYAVPTSTTEKPDVFPSDHGKSLYDDTAYDNDNKYAIPASTAATPSFFPSNREKSMFDDTEYDEAPEIINPEPEGYREFLDTLRAEVSGSHTQLWESFHSLFRKGARPLINGEAGGQFDSKTKSAVASMSTYLKNQYSAESEARTQLANDNAVKASSSFGQHILKRGSYGGFCSVPNAYDEPATRELGEDFSKTVRKSLGERAINALLMSESESEVSSYAGSSYAGSSNVESEYVSEAGSIASTNLSRYSTGSKVANKSPKKDSLPKVEEAKAKSIDSKSRSTPKSANSNAATKINSKFKVQEKKSKIPPIDSKGGSIPWAQVKLKSVSPTSGKPAIKGGVMQSPVDTETNVSSTSSTIPSSWAKVKLRKVQKEAKVEEKSGSTELTSGKSKDADSTGKDECHDADSIHHFVVRRPKSPPAAQANPQKTIDSTTSKTPAVPGPNTKSPKTVETSEEAPTETTSQEWDINAITSSVSTDSSIDGTTVVPLAPSPDSKTFFALKVVVGKMGIMKIDFPPNLSQANIIWRLEVDDLTSAMLDMSAYKVKLLQSNGEHKDLIFESSENCMKFANAFHEVANGSEEDESVSNSDGSVFVEQLSEEEQRLLEEFRSKKRLSKGTCDQTTITPSCEKEPLKLSLHDQIKAMATTQSTATQEPSKDSPISDSDQKIINSYKKMLQLRIPADAVRHKMVKDNVDSRLMNLVLGESDGAPPTNQNPNPTTNGLTASEEKIAATYQKMLKLKIPVEGVRHKMEKDGVDVKIILAVLGDNGTTTKTSNATTVTNTLSSADEEAAAPYRKMLKLRMPKEAVEHKMKKDGISPKIMASVLGVSPDSFSGRQKESKLTDEEESIASSFRKMLGLKISKESVRQKMETEGISEKIMVSVLGQAFMKGSNRGQKTPSRRRKGGFHWSPLTSQENLRKSVWNKTTLTESAESDVASDISKHIELFQKKDTAPDSSKTFIKKDGTEGKVMAKLIDLNRANNIAITLKAFNDVSQTELAQIIEFVDPYGKIKGDRALFMRDLLPAPAEVKAIQNYKGENDRLVPAEIWFKQIAHIKRIEEKIEVMRTMETFKLEILALSESFQMLTKVCNQVMGSNKLPDLLEMVRQIGNRMNEGRGEEAAGFKLDFLSRLSQTKGSDKKTTALDLVVMLFLARDQRAALRLTADFPECLEASKLQIGELSSDVRRLGGALEKCRKEKELLKKDGNIPKWGTLPSVEGDEYSIGKSVQKIEDFLVEATQGYDRIKEIHEDAIKTCKELSSFFCEDGGEKVTSKLLGILAGFATSLDATVKKQDEQEKRRNARLKSSQLKKSQTSRQTPKEVGLAARSPTNSVVSTVTEASDESSTRGKSLVFMVNQMLKIAGDKMKEDFANGITYEDPDTRLKQIYDRENAKCSEGPRCDIVGKIASRRETNEKVAQTGLSELVKRIEHRAVKSNAGRLEEQRAASSTTDKNISNSGDQTMSNVSSFESREEDSPGPKRRSSIADRWTRKLDEDQVSDTGASATLSSFSATSSEARMQAKRKQQVINRWASKDEIVEVASKDLEEGSDIGFSNSIVTKTRQRYLNRWATKARGDEDVE